MNELTRSTPPESFGRYLLYPAIASGGMATVHTARLVGAEGFTRLVAAKRLHPQLTDDPDFVTMFHDEACIASRIHHPNVVPVLDVVVAGRELILVQEYVHGVPLSQLMKIAAVAKSPIPIDVVVAVLVGVLAGLHAAHEVKDESGRPLEIVHRDVSPQNVMISVDGIPRLLDFGIAKARTSTHHTREGVFKGKLAYMAPEQLRMEATDRTIDIYAAGVLAWELLVNRRVYDGRHEIAFVRAVLNGDIPSIVTALQALRDEGAIVDERWNALVALAPVVSRAMSSVASERFATAAEMQRAIADVRLAATSMVVSEWVLTAGAEFLDQRERTLAANEESWRRTSVYSPTPSSGMQAVSAAPRSSAPPSLSFPSSGPPEESGAYRVALGVAPLARLGASVRSSRILPWLAAVACVTAGLVGGLLRGDDPPTAPAIQASPPLPFPPPSPPPALASVFPLAFASAPAPAPAPAPSPRLFHPAPAPAPPPRPPPPPRAAPPPPAPITSIGTTFSPSSSTGAASATGAAAASKSDCNPPFFFEGTKKVFKPTCL